MQSWGAEQKSLKLYNSPSDRVCFKRALTSERAFFGGASVMRIKALRLQSVPLVEIKLSKRRRGLLTRRFRIA